MKAVFIFFIPGFFVSFVFPFFLPAFLVYSLHCLHSSFHRFFVCLLLPSDPPCCVPLFLPSFLLSFFLSFLSSSLPSILPSFHPSFLPSAPVVLYFFLMLAKVFLILRNCVFDTYPLKPLRIYKGTQRQTRTSNTTSNTTGM